MKNEIYLRILSSLVIIPFSFFFIIKGSIYFNLFLLFCFFIAIYEWSKMAKNKPYELAGYFFLIFSFCCVCFVRNSLGDNSLFIFVFIITICISSDLGGYFFGKIFKGPKLTKISPKKTYAGMIGGYLLSIVSIKFLLSNTDFFNKNDFFFDKNEFIFVIALSTASQFGDILVSYFKRLSKIKDTGKLIPGHGGILDRIDGMIFAFPFFCILNLL